MARINRSDLFTQDATDLGPAILEASAPLATGKNKDNTDYALPTEYKTDATATAPLTAVNQAATQSCQPGYGTVSYHLAGAFVGTVAFEITLDGVNWFPNVAVKTDGSSASVTATTTGYFEAALPAGVVSARARCTAYTSGTITASVSVSPETYEPGVFIVGGATSLASGSAAIGRIVADGLWWTEAPTATLGAGLTWTGTSRDAFSVASGVTANNSSKPGRFRAHAIADQAFNLIVQTSDDGTTWDPVAVVASAALGGSAAVAMTDQPVYSRFMRAQMTNTAAAAFTAARCRTVLVASP